jgi:hypothetical protein
MVYAGILHDSYTNDEGKEMPTVEKVVGVVKDDVVACVILEDMSSFEMPKEEFLKKTEDLKVIFD